MNARGWMAVGFATLLLGACATAPAPSRVTFVVTRHAEKASDDPRDPSLSDAGRARAQALAERLADAHVVAAYATRYRRTQQTAAPVARRAGIEVITYDANEPANAFASRLRATHTSGTVLVVGHSNTAPAIAAALCTCTVPAMADDEFGTVHHITVHRDGRATLQTTHD